MSVNGGYQVLDLSAVNYDTAEGGAQTFEVKEGTYANATTTSKILLCSGMRVNGVASPDFYSTKLNRAGGVFALYTTWNNANLSIIINNDDTVTVATAS